MNWKASSKESARKRALRERGSRKGLPAMTKKELKTNLADQGDTGVAGWGSPPAFAMHLAAPFFGNDNSQVLFPLRHKPAWCLEDDPGPLHAVPTGQWTACIPASRHCPLPGRPGAIASQEQQQQAEQRNSFHNRFPCPIPHWDNLHHCTWNRQKPICLRIAMIPTLFHQPEAGKGSLLKPSVHSSRRPCRHGRRQGNANVTHTQPPLYSRAASTATYAWFTRIRSQTDTFRLSPQPMLYTICSSCWEMLSTHSSITNIL